MSSSSKDNRFLFLALAAVAAAGLAYVMMQESGTDSKETQEVKKLQDDETLAALDIKVMLLKYPDEVRRAFGKKQYHDEIDYIVTNEARNNLIKNAIKTSKKYSNFEIAKQHYNNFKKII